MRVNFYAKLLFLGALEGLQTREEASTLLCNTEIAPQPAATCWGAIEKSL
jgi:hypothetical protein